MARPRKSPPEIPGYWKDALPQKTAVRPGIPAPAPSVQSAGKRTRRRNVFLRYLLVASSFGVFGLVLWMAFSSSDAEPVSTVTATTGANVVATGPYELDYKTDGVIPKSYILGAIGNDTSRMPPIFDVKRKLEAVSQIREVTVRRLSGEHLSIAVFERQPVARIVVLSPSGEVIPRLVSAEGVVYDPINMGDAEGPDKSLVMQNLPQIKGSRLVPAGNYDIIEGFGPVAEFLNLARTKHSAFYRDWLRVSLKSYPGRADAPGAAFRVEPRPNTQPADAATLVEIVFSPIDFASELENLADHGGMPAIYEQLKSVDRAKYPAYRLDLSMLNLYSSRNGSSEPRLIPVQTTAKRP